MHDEVPETGMEANPGRAKEADAEATAGPNASSPPDPSVSEVTTNGSVVSPGPGTSDAGATREVHPSGDEPEGERSQSPRGIALILSMSGLLLSIFALIVSFVTAYSTILRQVDSIKIVAESTTTIAISQSRKLSIVSRPYFSFINSGNRNIEISNLNFMFIKANASNATDESICRTANLAFPADLRLALNFTFEPFEVRNGEIVVKKFDFVIDENFTRERGDGEDMLRYTVADSPFKVGEFIVACVRISIRTPSAVKQDIPLPFYHKELKELPTTSADPVQYFPAWQQPVSIYREVYIKYLDAD
jgi:hypothetical protein